MDKLFDAESYCAWLREQAKAKRPYWYGTCFQSCTEVLLKRKTEQYPAHYTSGRMSRYRADIAANQICADCVGGAIKGAAWTMLSTEKWSYASHGVLDKSANGMFDWCKSLGAAYGNINSIPDQPGIAVRMDGHVGVYVGNGEVVEWRGFAYGCVVTKLAGRPWTDWYELPWVIYAERGRRTLRVGMAGDDVKELQTKLAELGYDIGKWGADGEFGTATQKAVKQFQTDHKLEVDGIVGPLTWKALNGAEPKRKTYTVTICGVDQTQMEALKQQWPNCKVEEE